MDDIEGEKVNEMGKQEDLRRGISAAGILAKFIFKGSIIDPCTIAACILTEQVIILILNYLI